LPGAKVIRRGPFASTKISLSTNRVLNIFGQKSTMSQNSPRQVGLTYGLILGILLSMTTLVPFLAGVDPLDIQKSGAKGWMTALQLGVLVALQIAAIVKFKSLNGGYARFGSAFRTAFVTGAVAAMVIGLYMIFHTSQLVPDFAEKSMEGARIEMEKTNPDLPEEAVDKALSMVERFTKPHWIGMLSFISNLFPAVIFALLIAAFLKKDPPPGWEDVIDQEV
jgi:hypothetical protein